MQTDPPPPARDAVAPDAVAEAAGPARVRLARDAADIEAALALCRAAHAESQFAPIPFDEARVRASLAKALDKPGVGCVLLAERNGQAVGLLAGTAQEYMFSTLKAASAVVFFVLPEARGGSASLRLLQAFTDWGAARGARDVLIHVTSGVAMGPTDRFLRRIGFSQTGGNYALSVASTVVWPPG